MTLRLELASLLAGFDVERVRRERDEAVSLAATVRHILKESVCGELNLDEANDVIDIAWVYAVRFLESLPIGAVDSARKRLSKGGA